jgi:hypothetical protein
MRSEGKAPKNGEPAVGFYDNAPAHRSVLVNHFLAKSNVTTPENPQDSTDLASANFYFFS